ncbi:MAG: DUF6106 family protein [Roseburia sp.]|nr:DUF6106 family protein [Roseburia sp.]
MNESYKELLVKKERDIKQKLARVLCLVPTVLIGFFTLITGNIILFIVTVALGVLDYFVFQWTDIEYEYLYLDKEITIDKIMAKTRRKRACVIDVGKIEILAPVNSHQLDSYRNRQVKTLDYSAGNDLPEQKLYAAYYEGNQKYQLNLTEDFVKTIRGIIPRKVFMD